MLGLILSVFLVFASSYLVVSLLDRKNSSTGLLYFPIIVFAQIVLVFEILSLFGQIKSLNVLALQGVALVMTAIFWNKKSRPLWHIDFRPWIRKVLNAMRLDKTLAVLGLGFLFFVGVSVFLCAVMPVVHADSWSYHVSRSAFWAVNGNFNHFSVGDIRNIVLPINSEILYCWIITFIKNDFYLGFISLGGFLLTISSIYLILGLMGFSERKKLWTIFIFSSFASVIGEASSLETDVFFSGLILASIFLFWKGTKEKNYTAIFVSALSYALALGTKTPSFFAVPTTALFFFLICKKHKDYKPFGYFLAFGGLNFLIFSSYNYVLNFIDYGNFLTSPSFNQVSENFEGLRGAVAGFIKHFFLLFDFTGFTWNRVLGGYILAFRDWILGILGVSSVAYGTYNPIGVAESMNRTLLETYMGPGILGLLVFVPCLFIALIKPVFSKVRKVKLLGICALGFFISLAVMSYLLVFMFFSTRFMILFIAMASPVLTYSYMSNKNPFKYIVIFFALFYFILVSTHLWGRPVKSIYTVWKHIHSVSVSREVISCFGAAKTSEIEHGCVVRNLIKSIGKPNRFLIFQNSSSNYLYPELLALKGYKIDFALAEEIDLIDLNQYNVIFANNGWVSATNIRRDVKDRYKDWKVEFVDGKKTLIANGRTLVPCMPIDTKQKMISPDNGNFDKPPYSVMCFMSNKFFKANNLALIKQIRTDKIRLNVYENKNNPIIKAD